MEDVKLHLNPFFIPLNSWGQTFFIDGYIEQLDGPGREALKAWHFTPCTNQQCFKCLFDKSQNWITKLGIGHITTLCDLLSCLMSHQKTDQRIEAVSFENAVLHLKEVSLQ